MRVGAVHSAVLCVEIQIAVIDLRLEGCEQIKALKHTILMAGRIS